MAGWLVPERRGPSWKQSWTERTISTISTPPLPLLAVFAIVFFYLHLSDSYERALFYFKLFLYLLPVILIFLSRYSPGPEDANSGLENFTPENSNSIPRGAWTSPWRVAVLLLLLLLLISYHPISLKSKWFGNVSSSH